VRGGRRRAGEAPQRAPADGAAEQDPIRVLIVDDHGVVRRGLRGFLELLDEIDIVGEAENGAEAVAAVSRLLPDVVLMDLQMPQMDGIEATAAIRREHPEVAVVALTSFIEEHKVAAALEAGASGYLLKDAEADEVAGAIRRAARGEMHLDPAIGRILTDRIRGGS
jgi:DNA-binding NarL/FixJ family response regulator